MNRPMNWVKTLIILMGLLIALVMGKVALEGVKLSERPLVKWSEDPGPERVGTRLADFLYSRLQTKPQLCLLGSDPWFESFATSFVAGLEARGVRPQVQRQREIVEAAGDCWSLSFVRVDSQILEDCKQGIDHACTKARIFKKLKAESKPASSNWFSLYQTGATNTILLYHSK